MPAAARTLASTRLRSWKACAALICLGTVLGSASAYSQNTASPPSRPILFVHGICGSATDFQPLLGPLYQQLDTSLYPSPTIYYVLYDSVQKSVTFSILSGTQYPILIPVDEASIPSNTRFFGIELYDPIDETTDPAHVAKISILNKAYEISQVIKHITSITHVQDVIVIAHSMGGLDARAYIENMASPTGCYDYPNDTPYYLPAQCTPGSGNAAFAGDVGDLITVDTPHAGAPVAELNLTILEPVNACIANPSTNRTELNLQALGGAGLVEALNNGSALPNNGTVPATNTVPIQAIEDYFSDTTNPWDNFDGLIGGFLTGYSDDVVLRTSQSIQANLLPSRNNALLQDFPVGYLSSDSGIAATPGCWEVGLPLMHFMTCLANQPNTQNAIAQPVIANDKGTLTSINVNATYNGNAWPGAVDYQIYGPGSFWDPEITVPTKISDVPLGTYSISHIAGGPSSAGAPVVTVSPSPTIQLGQWSTTFTIAFSSEGNPTAPSAATWAATSPASDGATLNGAVNPNGSTVTAWFEYGASSTLQSFQSTTPVQSIVSGTTSVPATFALGGLSSNAQYYYRIAASNGGATVRGSIVSFTTLNTLPAPTLLTPANSSTGVSGVPQLTWTTVANPTSGYRVMMSTTNAALPTDPNSDACSLGCVLVQLGPQPRVPASPRQPENCRLRRHTIGRFTVGARPKQEHGLLYGVLQRPLRQRRLFAPGVSLVAIDQPGGLGNLFVVMIDQTSGTVRSLLSVQATCHRGSPPPLSPLRLSSREVDLCYFLAVVFGRPDRTYTLTVVVGTGSSASHTYPISVAVTQAAQAAKPQASPSSSPTSPPPRR